MAFSPEQIKNAVAFYTQSTGQQQRILRNPSAGVQQWKQGGGGGPAGPGTASDFIRKWSTGNGVLDAATQGTRNMVGDLLEPMDESQTPTNAVQWILNLLGTGGYATANIGNEAGRAVSKLQDADAGNDATGTWELITSPLAGAARGIGEGLGMRFDRDGDGKTERARTWGQNFEDIGVNDAVREGTRALGATDEGEHFFDNTGTWVGLTGLAGDILLDPLTYVSGIGLLKGISGAAKGTREALDAGSGLIRSLGAGARAGNEARAGAVAAAKGARAEAKELRQLRRTGGGSAEPQLALQRPMLAIEAPKPAAGQADNAVADLMESLSAPPKLDASARVQLLDDLARGAQGQRSRNLNADEILQGARVALGDGQLAPEAASALSQAMRGAGTLPELKTALTVASKSSPEMRKWLTEATVNVGGKMLPVGKALERAATLRMTGGYESTFVPLMNAVDGALSAAVGRQGVTPASLVSSLQRAIPELSEANPADDVMREFLGKFAAAPDQAAKKQVLLDQFGIQKVGYTSFDDLITGAIAGDDVGAETMREMLKGLGINTKLTDPDALRKTLTSRGKLNWETLKASVRTPEEVFTDHGISPATVAATKMLEEVELARAAKLEYSREIAPLGYDPLKVKPPKYGENGKPRAGASTGNAIAHAVATVSKHFTGKQWSEAYDQHAARWAYGAVMDTFKLAHGGKTGGIRGEALVDQMLVALRATEDHFRSIGQVPFYRTRAGRPNVYVSLGQALSAIPRQTALKLASGSMFYRLGKEVGDPQFSRGLSIYPTTMYRGVSEALAGAKSGRSGNELAAIVREAMVREAGNRNKFQLSAQGQEQLDELSQAFAHPAFLEQIHRLNEAQELMWTKAATATTKGIITPIGARIAAVLSRNGDRGELLTELRRAGEEIENLTKLPDEAQALGNSMARDMSNQALDNAVVNGILDEFEYSLARFDSRAGNMYPKPVGKLSPKSATATAQATRQAQTKNLVRLQEDAEDLVDEEISAAIAAGHLEDVDSVAIGTKGELQMSAGVAGLWGKVGQGLQSIGRTMNGSYGQGALHGSRLAAERSTGQIGFEQHRVLWEWLNGSRDGAVPSVLQRLGDDLGLGRPASILEANNAMKGWMQALGAYQTRMGNGWAPQGGLHTALMTGMKAKPKLNIPQPIPALPRAQADMAMELSHHLGRVFGVQDGPFARSGLTPADINPYLDKVGLGGFKLDENLTLAEQPLIWTTWGDIESPLNLVMGYHRAMTLAMQRPVLVSGVTHQFNHVAAGLSREDAFAQGWRAIDPTSQGSLAKFFSRDDLFPPEIRTNLAWVQRYLDDLDKDPNWAMSTIYKPMDAVASILKPSMTIWRPGHHGTIIAGNNLFMLAHGFNPLQNARVAKTMQALGGGGEVRAGAGMVTDEGITDGLTNFERMWEQDVADGALTGVEGTLKPRMVDQGVTLSLRDGARRVEPEELAYLARRYGIVQSPHQAKDVVPEKEALSFTSLGQRISHSRLNVIARTNEKIGRFTAFEDNVTRLSVMMQALESRKFASLDEAMTHALSKVVDVHPTREALSAAERRNATHIFLFYTWMRGALGSIMKVALEHPARVTLPSKFQYNMAQGYGMDPESYGKPIPTDPRIAHYYRQGVIGPSWIGGLSPFGGTGDLAEGEQPHLWGMSLNAPQMDALTSFFGGVNFGGDPLENTRKLAAGMNPVISNPIELLTDKQLGIATSKNISDNYPDYFWQQTGFPASVTNAFGLTGVKDSWTPEEQAGAQSQKLLNFLTGTKITDYTNPTSASVASSQRGEWEKDQLRQMGYSDEEIRWLRSYWKTVRSQQG